MHLNLLTFNVDSTQSFRELRKITFHVNPINIAQNASANYFPDNFREEVALLLALSRPNVSIFKQ